MPHPTGPAHPLHLDHQRGGGLRAQAGRIHVTVRPSAVAMLALVGWLVDGSPSRVVPWVLGGLAAMLVHEVAHAWVGRLGGATPYVELTWLAGLTRWQPPGALRRRTEVAALLAGPAVGGAVGWAALAGSRSVGALGGPAAALGAELLWVLGTVSLVVAALDLLPIFPRDGARLLLLTTTQGRSVAAVVRTATIGAVVAAMVTGLLLVLDRQVLALATGVLLVTNTWLAVRGDRAVGRPVPEAIEIGDWDSIRRRILAGCDSPHLAAQAQEHALSTSAFAEAAEIGDAALARGWHTIGFARRTATARAFNEQDDLAVARVRDAVALGADPGELAREPMLRHLTYRLDWPSAEEPRSRHGYRIDLRGHTAEPSH